MYLLLHADVCDSRDFIVSCAIEFTKKKVKSWLDKISLAKKLSKDKNFRGVEFFELTHWLEKNVEYGEGCLTDLLLNENAEELKNENTLVNTEIDRVHVYDNRILFSAYIDGTSVLLESEELGLGEIKRIYKALTCRPRQLPLLIDTDSSIVKSIVKARLKGDI